MRCRFQRHLSERLCRPHAPSSWMPVHPPPPLLAPCAHHRWIEYTRQGGYGPCTPQQGRCSPRRNVHSTPRRRSRCLQRTDGSTKEDRGTARRKKRATCPRAFGIGHCHNLQIRWRVRGGPTHECTRNRHLHTLLRTCVGTCSAKSAHDTLMNRSRSAPRKCGRDVRQMPSLVLRESLVLR